MNVAELREALADLPDDAPVLIWDEDLQSLSEVDEADVDQVQQVSRELPVGPRTVRAALGMPITVLEWRPEGDGREGLVLRP
jgi:hypothetical protein